MKRIGSSPVECEFEVSACAVRAARTTDDGDLCFATIVFGFEDLAYLDFAVAADGEELFDLFDGFGLGGFVDTEEAHSVFSFGVFIGQRAVLLGNPGSTYMSNGEGRNRQAIELFFKKSLWQVADFLF
jgi:hypothetical protein